MAQNIMMTDRPLEVLGEFDPCRTYGVALRQCYVATQQHLTYQHFSELVDKQECESQVQTLDQCRERNGMAPYRKFRKQDDVPRAPYRKHPTASDRMVQEHYPYPGGRIP